MTKEKSPPGEKGARYSPAPIIQINSTQVKEKARGNWELILSSLGVPETNLRNKPMPCPACGGKDRYRWDNKFESGDFYCSHCGPGDGFTLLMNLYGWSFRDTLEKVAEVLLIPDSNSTNRSETAKGTKRQSTRRYIQWLWGQARPISPDCPAALYFRKRELDFKAIPSSLKWITGLKYFEGSEMKGVYPCIVAAVQSHTNQIVSIHRTYISVNGEKAPVSAPKKLTKAVMDGATKGAAIRLFPPSETLVVAEGIETAIASHIAWNLPAWATVSALGMEEVILPAQVRSVVIAADNDKSERGLEAAFALCSRLKSEGRETQILMPKEQGLDMADIVKKERI